MHSQLSVNLPIRKRWGPLCNLVIWSEGRKNIRPIKAFLTLCRRLEIANAPSNVLRSAGSKFYTVRIITSILN